MPYCRRNQCEHATSAKTSVDHTRLRRIGIAIILTTYFTACANAAPTLRPPQPTMPPYRYSAISMNPMASRLLCPGLIDMNTAQCLTAPAPVFSSKDSNMICQWHNLRISYAENRSYTQHACQHHILEQIPVIDGHKGYIIQDNSDKSRCPSMYLNKPTFEQQHARVACICKATTSTSRSTFIQCAVDPPTEKGCHGQEVALVQCPHATPNQRLIATTASISHNSPRSTVAGNATSNTTGGNDESGHEFHNLAGTHNSYLAMVMIVSSTIVGFIAVILLFLYIANCLYRNRETSSQSMDNKKAEAYKVILKYAKELEMWIKLGDDMMKLLAAEVISPEECELLSAKLSSSGRLEANKILILAVLQKPVDEIRCKKFLQEISLVDEQKEVLLREAGISLPENESPTLSTTV